MADENSQKVVSQFVGVKVDVPVAGVERIQESYNPATDLVRSLNPAVSLLGTTDTLPQQNAGSSSSIWDTVSQTSDSKKD